MRALVVSLQYNDFENAKLNGCYYDGERIITQLKKMDRKIKIVNMRDDLDKSSNLFPTRYNILRELKNMILSGETRLFFYYSGHGSYAKDYNRDELSIYFRRNGLNILLRNSLFMDSCLVTNEKDSLGLLSDDMLANVLRSMKSRQLMYSFMDSCHSGTGLDLCYVKLGDLRKTVKYRNARELIINSRRNTRITSSYYPDKVNKVKGNVILISGTRDNAYSYESEINGKSQGHFTTALVKALNLGLYRLPLSSFYTSLIGLLNTRRQMPVLTTSKRININRYRLLGLNTKTRLSKRQQQLLLFKNRRR